MFVGSSTVSFLTFERKGYFSSKCFISFATASSDYSIENASLIFINNSAGKEGTVLYGGELSKCLLYCSGNDTDCKLNTHGKQIHSAMEVFMNKSHIISRRKCI